MKKLILMTDFVLEQRKIHVKINGFADCVFKYANFLKQPLKLGMFVPCDEEGNILEDPGLIPSYKLEIYRKAKDRVLFEGVEIKNYKFIHNIEHYFLEIDNKKFAWKFNKEHFEFYSMFKTIEDLIPYNLTLIEK